jgi:hypothetical protein
MPDRPKNPADQLATAVAEAKRKLSAEEFKILQHVADYERNGWAFALKNQELIFAQARSIGEL